ncbi:hypothetical protein GCM10022421_32300 [Oceanisphaera sediminis]|uniref:DUF2513 domain-containing protein n=1 Tax=Oceanisphaera sediminis TaxID=981381 RepID=A0ABP7EPV8_9GAMM
MKMDRELQNAILKRLNEDAFELVHWDDIKGLADDEKNATQCLIYMEHHGLVELITTTLLEGGTKVEAAKITGDGQDYIDPEGGLGAELNVLTVNLHEDTLRRLLELGIAQGNISQAEKSRVKTQIQALPADSIKHLTMKLMDWGLENAPRAIQLISTLSKGS